MEIKSEEGLGVLLAVIALSVFSLLALYMSLSTTTEVRISDNFESDIRARQAAHAGLKHARALLRGIPYDLILAGPDGTHDASSGYLSQAKTFSFRNPISWTAASSLDIDNADAFLAGIPDDGLINTGHYGATPGTQLIPANGIAFTVPNPYGSGTVNVGRYFVRASDNNGEASELAGDASNDPFVDGDGILIVRSIGVAQTITENVGSALRRNSVAIVEARFKQSRTFSLPAPVVVQGSSVMPSSSGMFDGASFRVDGAGEKFGIATIDVDAGDALSPAEQIVSQVSAEQRDHIVGIGGRPSISDLTSSIRADTDRSLLLSPEYLSNFAALRAPAFADNTFQGNQNWSGASPPELGTYDPSKEAADPSQNPKATVVDGSVYINGTLSGAGLLVIRGRLAGSGAFNFTGLILLIGAGELDLSGLSLAVTGGVYLVNIAGTAPPTFGIPKITIAGLTNIVYDGRAVAMAVSLIPPRQLSWREITGTIDP